MTIENSYSLIGAIIWVDPFFSFSGIVFFLQPLDSGTVDTEAFPKREQIGGGAASGNALPRVPPPPADSRLTKLKSKRCSHNMTLSQCRPRGPKTSGSGGSSGCSGGSQCVPISKCPR